MHLTAKRLLMIPVQVQEVEDDFRNVDRSYDEGRDDRADYDDDRY